MTVVWKYNLQLSEGLQYMEMPEDSVGLTVAMQHERLTLWAEVDPDKHLGNCTFRVIATGETFETDDYYFVGTVFNGPFVWHVYQLFPPEEN